MAKGFEGGEIAIYNWLRNRNTLEFLAIWEELHNPNFNSIEFDRIKKNAGLNSFVMSPKKWRDTTNAIGVTSRAGKFGGIYAHTDIAFEFGAWLNPKFKLLLIKEFQRLKQAEIEGVQWDYRRFLSKVNYALHTDAIKENIIPTYNFPKGKDGFIYAAEADILNLALFGCTAQQWREKNPDSVSKGNIRDFATVEQLTVLSNLESLNATYIGEGIGKQERFYKLKDIAEKQMKSLMARRSAITPIEAPKNHIDVPFEETIHRLARVKPPKKD